GICMHSSRLPGGVARFFPRSSNGLLASSASSSTRLLNSIHDSSRPRKRLSLAGASFFAAFFAAFLDGRFTAFRRVAGLLALLDRVPVDAASADVVSVIRTI